MLYLEWALLRTKAFRQLALLLSRYVVSIVLPCMTRLAEVSITPAEPLSYIATELALEFDVVKSVLRAVLNSSAN